MIMLTVGTLIMLQWSLVIFSSESLTKVLSTDLHYSATTKCWELRMCIHYVVSHN